MKQVSIVVMSARKKMKRMEVMGKIVTIVLATIICIGLLPASLVGLKPRHEVAQDFTQDFIGNHGPSVGFENVKKPKEYPPLTSYIGGEKGGVTLTTSVKQVDDKFEYTYIIKNTSDKDTWLAGSSLPDLVTLGHNEIVNYYLLAPGESASTTLLHKDKPVECGGFTSILINGKLSGLEYVHKELGLENVKYSGVQTTYSFQMSGGTNGWVPKGLSKRVSK